MCKLIWLSASKYNSKPVGLRANGFALRQKGSENDTRFEWSDADGMTPVTSARVYDECGLGACVYACIVWTYVELESRRRRVESTTDKNQYRPHRASAAAAAPRGRGRRISLSVGR